MDLTYRYLGQDCRGEVKHKTAQGFVGVAWTIIPERKRLRNRISNTKDGVNVPHNNYVNQTTKLKNFKKLKDNKKLTDLSTYLHIFTYIFI